MGTCATCKHWKPDDLYNWEATRAEMRECAAIRARWVIADEATEGLSEGDTDDDFLGPFDMDKKPSPKSFLGVKIAALQEAKAYVQDGSQYIAELFTASDFGCTLWRIADAMEKDK